MLCRQLLLRVIRASDCRFSIIDPWSWQSARVDRRNGLATLDCLFLVHEIRDVSFEVASGWTLAIVHIQNASIVFKSDACVLTVSQALCTTALQQALLLLILFVACRWLLLEIECLDNYALLRRRVSEGLGLL